MRMVSMFWGRPLTFCVVLVILGGCAKNAQFRELASGILSETGLLSSSQTESFFMAGEKLGKAASSLTAEQEYYLGRGVAATLFAKYKPYRNESVNRYVNRVAAVLAAQSDRPETFGGYRVQVLDSNDVNAMAAPGGFIFITKGFLKRIPNEDALAAVIAHEVAHVVKGHGVAAIRQANLTDALIIIGKERVATTGEVGVQELTALFGNSIDDVVSTLTEKGYSRRQEYAADEYGALLLARAGYQATAMNTMLEAIPSEGSGGWLSTHPAAEKRQRELRRALKDEPASMAGFRAREARYRATMKVIS